VLTRVLEKTAARDPQGTALRWRGRSISWSELVSAVRARADEFARAGVGTGDGVAIVLPNSPDFVISFFAAASLGAVAIPLNPQSRSREIATYLGGCQVAAIVCTADGSATCEAAAQAVGPSISLFVCEADSKLPTTSGEPPPREVIGEDVPALYGFSSGTTGTPKRIARTQGQLCHEAENFTATVGVSPADTILGVVPFFHAHGLGNCVLASVRSGAPLVVLERFERNEVLETIGAEQVTIFPAVPFLLQNLAARDSDADLSSLRLCFTAGTGLPVDTFETFRDRFGCEVRQLYGCTEAGSVCINLDPDIGATCESVGRPIRNIEVAILDQEQRPCQTDEVGEIAFRSPAAGTGYAGLDDVNCEVFRDGWFRTGDLGALDREGRLQVRGRIKLFIDTPAGKVDPVELERCVSRHPKVVEAAAVGVPSRSGAELVKLVLAVGEDWAGEERELRREIVALCREQLTEFKLPRIVELRAELPRSAAGKLLRSKLIAPLTDQESET
jgi:long-chain acyl-CoA synthetase